MLKCAKIGQGFRLSSQTRTNFKASVSKDPLVGLLSIWGLRRREDESISQIPKHQPGNSDKNHPIFGIFGEKRGKSNSK